jgi:biotin synthase-related radical SAM superfamily protein
MMTPKELINKLSTYEGPCMRLCAYCPEDFNTAEVKKCVEKMIETIYKLQCDKDNLLDSLVKVRAAYKEATGEDYRED